MLELQDIGVQYGQVQAVHGLSMAIQQGEIVALVGPNGAGKTSTLMAVSGVVRPASGRIIFLGDRTEALPPHEIVRRGIVQVPEGRMIFAEMTVRENLLMGAYTRRGGPDLDEDMGRVLDFFPKLRERMVQRAGTLSGGELQMLAIARSLLARPKLLLLDEPSLGLAPLIVEEVFGLIGKLHDMGTTILLVEQNLRKALALADRAYLLEAGELVESGTAEDMLRSERVMRSYLGVSGLSRIAHGRRSGSAPAPLRKQSGTSNGRKQ